MTSCVSDAAVSRLVRLCVETADGSGDVSVIREPYAGLFCIVWKKYFVFEHLVINLAVSHKLTLNLWLGSRHRR